MVTDNFIFEKSANALLDFSINWTNFLDGGTIDSSDWTLDPNLSIVNTSISGVYTTIWISGGITGNTYCGENTIQSGSLQDSATFSVFVR